MNSYIYIYIFLKQFLKYLLNFTVDAAIHKCILCPSDNHILRDIVVDIINQQVTYKLKLRLTLVCSECITVHAAIQMWVWAVAAVY